MRIWSIPNALSGLRLLLVPVIWVLAVLGFATAVAIGLIVAALTDVFDGFLARRLNQITPFGSKLDSIADLCVNGSALGWLLLLAPFVVRDHPFFFGGMALIGIILVWAGWVKYRRLVDFHLTTGRAAGVVGYLFLIHLLLTGSYHRPLFYLLMALAWLVAAETLVLLLNYDRYDRRVPSPIVAVLFHGGQPKHGDAHRGFSER